MRPLVLVDVRALVRSKPEFYEDHLGKISEVQLEPKYSEICEELRNKFGEEFEPEFRFFAGEEDYLAGLFLSEPKVRARFKSLKELKAIGITDFIVQSDKYFTHQLKNLLSHEEAKNLVAQQEQSILVVSPDNKLLWKFSTKKCTRLRVASGGELQGLLELGKSWDFKATLDDEKPLVVYCDIDDSLLMTKETFEKKDPILNPHLIEYLKNLGRRFPGAQLQLITSRKVNHPLETGRLDLKFARDIKATVVLEKLKAELASFKPLPPFEGKLQVADEIIFTNGQPKLDVIDARLGQQAQASQMVLLDDQSSQFLASRSILGQLQRKNFSVFGMPIASQGDLLQGITDGLVQRFKEQCKPVSVLGKHPRSSSSAEPARKSPNLFQGIEEAASVLSALRTGLTK